MSGLPGETLASDEEQERSCEPAVLDERAFSTLRSMRRSPTGAEGAGVRVRIEKGRGWTCHGAPFSDEPTAARFTRGLRGCHRESL